MMTLNAQAFKKLRADARELGIRAIPRPGARHVHDSYDAGSAARSGPRGLAEEHNPVGQIERLVDIVRDQHDRRRFGGMNVEEEILHGEPSQRIESTEGFVEHEHTGTAGEGSGESRTLCHSARDLARAKLARLVELHEAKELCDSGLSGGAIRAAGQTNFDVSHDRTPRQEPRLLKRNGATLVDADERATVDAYLAGTWCIEPNDLPQQCRLPATGGTDERHDLAGRNFERHIGENPPSRYPAFGCRERPADSAERHRQRRSVDGASGR